MAGRAHRFFAREDGSSTIEFALLFPVFMGLFLACFEVGMIMTRQVMLDRALDIAVRGVRIGTFDDVNHTILTQAICERTLIIRDCDSQIRLEMRTVDLRSWANPPAGADCVDRDDPSKALRAFNQGSGNQLMLLRACALIDPVFPGTGIGAALTRQSTGGFAIVSTASFVMEPE